MAADESGVHVDTNIIFRPLLISDYMVYRRVLENINGIEVIMNDGC